MDTTGSDGPRVLDRKAFLALAGAGLAVVAGLPATARARIAPRRFSHDGADVEIRPQGSGAEISVDGVGVGVVDSNGAYRAAGFMYSPQPTLEGLARRLAEARTSVAGL